MDSVDDFESFVNYDDLYFTVHIEPKLHDTLTTSEEAFDSFEYVLGEINTQTREWVQKRVDAVFGEGKVIIF